MSQCPNVLIAEVPPLALQASQQFENKQFAEALSSYDRLIKEFPEKKEAYFNRGLCFYKLQKFSEAIFDFDECRRMDSTFREARLMRALSLEKRGDWKEALAEYEALRSNNTYHSLLERRIKNYRLAVILSKNWYYMIALMLIVILLMAVAVKSITYKKG